MTEVSTAYYLFNDGRGNSRIKKIPTSLSTDKEIKLQFLPSILNLYVNHDHLPQIWVGQSITPFLCIL